MVALSLFAVALGRSVRNQDAAAVDAAAVDAAARLERTVRAEEAAGAQQLAQLYAAAAQTVDAEAGSGFVPDARYFAGAPTDSAGRPRSVPDYFAYVVTYVLGEQFGHTIYHTSMAFCPRTGAREEHYAEYAAYCQDSFWRSCWRADPLRTLQQADVVAGDCKELAYGLAGDIGVQVADTPWRYGNDRSPNLYALGPVSGTQIDAALAFTQQCGHNGKKLDFNAGTYDLIGHNCHHHVDQMLGQLRLPLWAEKKTLEDEFMPEDPDHNPIRSAIVHSFMKVRDRTSGGCRAWRAEQERLAAAAARRSCFGGDCGGPWVVTAAGMHSAW